MREKKYLPIEGYNNEYLISNDGDVKSMKCGKEKILVKAIVNGYHKVLLYKNNNRIMVSVHRLVAMTFLPIDSKKGIVNHINGVKTDNRVENLEWCSQSENSNHAYVLGLRTKPVISQEGRARISNSKYKKVINTETNFVYNSMSDAAHDFDISLSSLSQMLSGKTKNKTPLQYERGRVASQNKEEAGSRQLVSGQVDSDIG